MTAEWKASSPLKMRTVAHTAIELLLGKFEENKKVGF
jgi:hypothetical protein